MHAKIATIPKVAAFEVGFLRKIRDRIRAIDGHAEAFLFGSRARGDNRYDSDYDILVLSETFAQLSPEERWHWFYNNIMTDREDTALQPQLWTPSEWRQMAGSLLHSEVTRDMLTLADLLGRALAPALI